MRLKVVILGLVVALVLGGWSAGWLWGAGQIRQQVLALADNDGEAAPQLTCGTFNVGGFPFWFQLACEDATLVSGDETLTLKGLRAAFPAYDPTHVIFSALSPYSMQNAFTGSQSRVDFKKLEASAKVTTDDIVKGLSGADWRIGRISVVGDSLVWSDTVLGDVLQAKADYLELQVADLPAQHDKAKGSAALGLSLQVGGLDAPGFDITAGAGLFDATLSGLPDDLMVLANDPEPLKHWQQRGGSFEISRLKGDQPDPAENFEIKGNASLTDAGLVNAQLSYSGEKAMDRLARFLPPMQLAMLKGQQDAAGHFSNSITVIDGKLKLLTMTLAELPPLF